MSVRFWLLQILFADVISSGTGNRVFEEEKSEEQKELFVQ